MKQKYVIIAFIIIALDNIIIILVCYRLVPQETGWILDGFPSSYLQAKLLEKALSGIDSEGKEMAKSKSKKSVLAPDPRPQPPSPEPASGINVVILFEIPNEVCLRRSAGRTRKLGLATLWNVVILLLIIENMLFCLLNY